MNNQLWEINKEKLQKTNLYLYSKFIEKIFKINFECNFNKIWKWSIDNPEFFWQSIWNFTKVRGSLGKGEIENSKTFYKTKFFPDAKINYAENLLQKNNETPAIIFKSENGFRNELSWKILNSNVTKISHWLKSNK